MPRPPLLQKVQPPKPMGITDVLGTNAVMPLIN